MVIKIDTKTKTKCILAQRPIWRLKLRLVEWIWPKKSHKTKNTIFDLYRGHAPISLASEAGIVAIWKLFQIWPHLINLNFFNDFCAWFSILFHLQMPVLTSKYFDSTLICISQHRNVKKKIKIKIQFWKKFTFTQKFIFWSARSLALPSTYMYYMW